MAFIVGFLFLIALVGVLFYLLVIYREVPGAMEQRFGTLEALPADVNQWKADADSDEGKAAMQQGLTREVRLFVSQGGGFLGGQRLVRQVRYKNRATNAVTRVDPDEVVKRKRVRT